MILPTTEIHQYHGKDGFGDLIHDSEPDISIIKPDIAALALGRIVTENPGEISVVAIGPLTNIALAVKLFPTFMEDVKEIYIMGGNHLGVGNTVPAAEFNFYVDPEAANIVLENAVKPIYILTWEATLDTNISFVSDISD